MKTNDVEDAFLDSFSPMTRRPEGVLKGNRLPPYFDVFAPAYFKSNVQAVRAAQVAARDHNLPSPRFEAVRARFSETHHSMLLIPEALYDETDPELYRVAWSSTGLEMRIDFAEALVPRQWATSKGWIRRVQVELRRNLPRFGTVLLVDLAGGVLRENPRTARERNRRKAKREAKLGEAVATC